MANAMDVRGYVVGANRTKIDVMRMRFSDYFISCCTGILTVTILLRVGVINVPL